MVSRPFFSRSRVLLRLGILLGKTLQLQMGRDVTQENPTSHDNKVQAAQYQLDLILSFFPRVDTLLLALLGVSLAMLGVAFARAPAFTEFGGVQTLGAFTYLGTAVVSFVYLYRGSFPNLDGGFGSLIYFREIAKLEPGEYVRRYLEQSEGQLSDGILRQAWRNACILDSKFKRLKLAYRWLLASAGPWALLLLSFPPGRGA